MDKQRLKGLWIPAEILLDENLLINTLQKNDFFNA